MLPKARSKVLLSGVWLICLMFSHAAFSMAKIVAREPVVLAEQDMKINLAKYCLIFEDRTAALGFDKIRNLFPRRFDKFDPPDKFQSYGFTNSHYWYQFSIKNPTDQAIKTILELGNPLVDVFELFIVSDEGIERRVYGNNPSYYQRDIDSNLLAAKLIFPPHSEQQIFVRFDTINTDYFPLYLYLGDYYEGAQVKHQVTLGIFLGIMLGLFAYNAFLFASTRTPIYFYYLCLALSSALFMASRNNLLYRFWPNSYEFNLSALYAFSLLWVLSLVKFFQSYTETKTYYPSIHKLANYFSVYTCFALIMMVMRMDMKLFHSIYVLPAFIVTLFFFYVSYMRLKDGYIPILFFAVGLAMPVLAAALRVLVTIGWLDDMQTIELFANNMDALQLIIFSLGLANSLSYLAKEKLNKEKQAISASVTSAIKNQFINKMSFQIRTPLNDVIGGAELIANTDLTKDQAYCINVVKSSGQSLLTIVDDIIDLLNANYAELKLDIRPFNLAEHLEEYSSIFQVQINEKNIEFLIELDRGTPLELLGDTTRLRQLLLNLLGNAFKFTEVGTIKLGVTCLDVNYHQRTCEIKFTVTDSGIGISEENQLNLFQSYSQADLSVTRRYGGTGLGLTICRRLISLMDGNIGFDSLEGKGSTFWFVLPLPLASIEQQRQAEKRWQRIKLAPEIKLKRVLVAEDDPANQQVIKGILSVLGVESRVVNDGFEAVDEYRRGGSEYQLILLDSLMPNLDGVEAAKMMRRMETELGYRQIPIVSVSAKVMPEDIFRSKEAGINGYIRKPLLIKDMINEIERLWKLGAFS